MQYVHILCRRWHFSLVSCRSFMRHNHISNWSCCCTRRGREGLSSVNSQMSPKWSCFCTRRGREGLSSVNSQMSPNLCNVTVLCLAQIVMSLNISLMNSKNMLLIKLIWWWRWFRFWFRFMIHCSNVLK